MSELLKLSSSDLLVEVAVPGTDYTGARFDWTTQVRQVTVAGEHTFLTRESLAVAGAEGQGWGLSGEWGIERSVGFDDCPTGDWFPKIGVGLLQRFDDKPYHFFRRYPVRPCETLVKSLGGDEVVFVQTQSEYRGFGWILERRWSVSGSELHLNTVLKNTGARPLATDEYLHNFMRFGEATVNSDWSLVLDVPLERHTWSKDVDPQHLWSADDRTLSWTKSATAEFFFSRLTTPSPTSWELRHASGLRVSETAQFQPHHFNLWGKGHVVSPELFWDVSLEPGQTQESSRTWSFTRDRVRS